MAPAKKLARQERATNGRNPHPALENLFPKSSPACLPFRGVLTEDENGIYTITCEACHKQWRQLDDELAMAVEVESAARCAECDVCAEKGCLFCRVFVAAEIETRQCVLFRRFFKVGQVWSVQ